MSFIVAENRSVPGTVSFNSKFPTIRFNGMYGTPEIPAVGSKHKLRAAVYQDKIVQYVKDHLPSLHPLVQKGWTQLPPMVWELDSASAVPT